MSFELIQYKPQRSWMSPGVERSPERARRYPPGRGACARAPSWQHRNPLAPPLGGFDRLTIDHRRRRACLATCALAIRHDERVVHPLEQACISPGGEPTIHGAPRRKVRGEKPPGAAGAHDVEDCVDHLSEWPCARAAVVTRGVEAAALKEPIRRQSDRWHSASPFGYDADGWSGSTWQVPRWLQQPLGIRAAPATQDTQITAAYPRNSVAEESCGAAFQKRSRVSGPSLRFLYLGIAQLRLLVRGCLHTAWAGLAGETAVDRGIWEAAPARLIALGEVAELECSRVFVQ